MKKPEFKKPEFKLNINYEFSKREKVMIYILGMAALIVAAIFLVFMPSLNRYQELSSKRDETEFKQQEMQMAIAGLDTKRKSKVTATAELASKKEGYDRKMNNEQLDNLITTLMVDEGFRAQDLSITSNEIAAVPTFGSDATEKTETQSDTTTQTKEMADLAKAQGNVESTDNSTTTTADKPITGIYIGTVTMTAVGNLGQFENLLDTVNGRSDIQVVAFDVSPAELRQSAQSALSSVGISASSVVSENIKSGYIGATVTYNVYMIDKSTTVTDQQTQTTQ